MALVALRAELTGMHVITDVTATATGRHITGATIGVAVAVIALQCCVTAVKRETRVQIVIKRRQRPVIGVMARRTIVTEAALVRIDVTVAIDAVGTSIVEKIVRMAGTASDRGMQTGERKRR